MRRINTFSLYKLGKELQPIDTIDEDAATFDAVLWILIEARSQVKSLMDSDVLPVRTCRQAAQDVIKTINDVVPVDLKEALAVDKNKKIDWWGIRQIKDATKKFETVLAEELAIVDTYSVSQKGAFSTSELINNAEVMFSKQIQNKLPKHAIQDMREAGRCLAFERPTAAAFHTVRAIESVILAYFEKVLSRKPPNRMRNWGVYIKTLRDSGKADPKILDFLAHIKDNYRNPISHPDAILSVEEVLVLLGVAVGAMTQMATAL